MLNSTLGTLMRVMLADAMFFNVSPPTLKKHLVNASCVLRGNPILKAHNLPKQTGLFSLCNMRSFLFSTRV